MTTDLSMAKDVPVGGNVRLQVRVELFDAFNNVNNGNPGASFGAATFAYQLQPETCGRCSWGSSSIF